jgi:hypothetical protein
VVIYILLNAIGIFIGKLLGEINIILPQQYLIFCICCTIILWAWYPVKDPRRSFTWSSSYLRRKLFDFSLGTVTLLLIIYTGNHWQKLFIKTEAAQASKVIRIPKDAALHNHSIIQNFINLIKSKDVSKLTQREKIRLIKQQIKTVKQDKETSKGGKAALIILSVLVALALLFGLAALSCSIACGGAEALAAIVAIGGTALIVFFLVRMIRRISNPPPKKEAIKNNDEG